MLTVVVTGSNLWWRCFSLSRWRKDSLAPAVVSPIATFAGGVFLPPTGADTGLTLGQLALCGGGFLVVMVVVDVCVCVS